jgi:hypothetical protein
MSRELGRRAVCLLGASALLFVAREAHAGSYLNRAHLMIRHGMKEMEYLRARVNDKELASVVHQLAQARLDAGRKMTVPTEVAMAHPHVLLVLENCERAAQGAVDGDAEKFMIFYQRALDEERTLRFVLKKLGWSLPDER